MDNFPTELVSLVARYLGLRDIVQLSALNSVFRKGCYDPSAIRDAVSQRDGGKLTSVELQQFLRVDRLTAATLAHRAYPKTIFHPRGCYMFDASVVATAMHTFGQNERVVSWKPPRQPQCPPPPPPTIRKRAARPDPSKRARKRIDQELAYAVCNNLPNAASCGSRAAASLLPSMLSPSGWATPVM